MTLVLVYNPSSHFVAAALRPHAIVAQALGGEIRIAEGYQLRHAL